ncbi:Uncharacterised protein r2_g3962 [Pycnogonum litorale]
MPDDATTSGSSLPQGVHAVACRLPAYWSGDPQLWFGQVEGQFQASGITTELTKYEYVVAALPPDTAAEVRDLIVNMPTERPYTVLKTAVISRTAESDLRRLNKLLHKVELGDRKPSQLLRRMEQLVGNPAATNSHYSVVSSLADFHLMSEHVSLLLHRIHHSKIKPT